MAVAARLLVAMPVVGRDGDFQDDRWESWLKRHSLTRSDGRWLADRRDPSPLKRRPWTTGPSDQNWRWSVGVNDFFDVLVCQKSLPHWLCVAGRWTECEGMFVETLRVSSALINPETADALATSLRWARDAMDYRLPFYRDPEAEVNEPPFELTGWVVGERGGDKRLDGFDPYAREIAYPPHEIGESFAKLLGITPDYEHRTWCRLPSAEPAFISEIWSEKASATGIGPTGRGIASVEVIDELTRLCLLTGKELLFSVEINRNHQQYRGSSSDEFSCLPVSHEIFILSADGRLRDARQSHQLG